MSVSKADVLGLSVGWWFIGVHYGARNHNHWTIQLLTALMLFGSVIVLIEA